MSKRGLNPKEQKIHDALFDINGTFPTSAEELAAASGEGVEDVELYLEKEGL